MKKSYKPNPLSNKQSFYKFFIYHKIMSELEE